MNEMLERIAEIDPDYVKRYRRQWKLLGFAVSAAVIAIAAVVVLGFYGNATYVQKTACSSNPASQRCAELRLEIAKAEPLRNPCASFQRVTSRRGRNCDHFYVKPSGRSKETGPSRSRGGGAVQPGSTGHQQPGPRGGGHPEGAGGADHGDGHASDPPPPAAAPGSSPTGSSAGSATPNPSAPSQPSTSSPGTVPSTVEAAGGAVKEAGEGVGGAVEGVGKSVDCALRGSC
jgi:hypothetical protein